jgi:hypothetical protein
MAKQRRSARAPEAATSAAVEKTAPSAGATAAASRREALREAAIRRRRNQNYLIMGGVGAVVLVIVAAIFFAVRGQAPVVGEESLAARGNTHIEVGTSAATSYNSVPPTSGPHYGTIARWGVHSEPVRYEYLVHNLEDGGVVIYYQCDDGCPELVAELEAVVQPFVDADRNVILAPNDPTWTEGGSGPLHQDMGARIALTAWQKLLTLDEVDAEAIKAFIERYEGIDNHRG